MFVPMVSELARGWRPFSDNAAIASRAYQSLSLHPPLVGMISSASVGTGHLLFDPGPLQFYVLAVPVHLDPSHGLFWGSALVAATVLSLAIEAAWSAGQWVAGAVLAFAALDLLWLTPSVFENLPWNAYFPLPFLMAAVVLAWAVALGKAAWWPVLVFVGSVAAQSHLLFVIPAAALVLLALIFVLASDRHPRHPRRLRWIGVGVGIGFVCWLPPLIQEAGGRGNLTALAHAGGGRPTIGFVYGLRLVGDAGGLHPLWLTHLPTKYTPLGVVLNSHSSWFGGVIFALLLVITLAALAAGERRLGTLGCITLALAASLLVAFALFPAANYFSLGYLVASLWVLSILIWSVFAWAVVKAGAWAWHEIRLRLRLRLRFPAGDGVHAASGPVELAFRAGPALAAAAFALVVVIAAVGIQAAVVRPIDDNWTPQEVVRDNQAAEAIERVVPRGPVAIEVGPASLDFFLKSGSAQLVAYRLQTDGWQPGLTIYPGSAASGLVIPHLSRWPTVLVTMTGRRGFTVAKIG
jgi:hypothetical protein